MHTIGPEAAVKLKLQSQGPGAGSRRGLSRVRGLQ